MTGKPRVEMSAATFALLARFVHRAGQAAAAELKREGLTPAQFQLLLAVQRDPGATQRELGNRFDVTRGNVSMLVAKLETAGLLMREADGASNRVALTDTGAELVSRLAPAQDAFLVACFATLDDGRLRRLHDLVDEALHGLSDGPEGATLTQCSVLNIPEVGAPTTGTPPISLGRRAPRRVP